MDQWEVSFFRFARFARGHADMHRYAEPPKVREKITRLTPVHQISTGSSIGRESDG
jgi:hypothetical protein